MTVPQHRRNRWLGLTVGAIVLCSTAYWVYTTVKRDNGDGDDNEPVQLLDLTGGEDQDTRKKVPAQTRITMVVSSSTLRKVEQYNESNEAGISIQEYLRYYPRLVLVCYPGIELEDLSNYFELETELRSRIISTTSEESCFHVAKQLAAEMNLLDFGDFTLPKADIMGKYHIDSFLSNLIDMDGHVFIDFI